MQLRTLLGNHCSPLVELLLMAHLSVKQFAARGCVLLDQIVGGRGDFTALPSDLLGLARLLLVGLLGEIHQPLIGRVTPGQGIRIVSAARRRLGIMLRTKPPPSGEKPTQDRFERLP